jgi:isovaleryl-CoA dehydrogenase
MLDSEPLSSPSFPSSKVSTSTSSTLTSSTLGSSVLDPSFSYNSEETFDLYHPKAEHRFLRQVLKDFVKKEVEPQAEHHDKTESFNIDLFRKLGSLGLLGITAPSDFGGSGMDAVAAVIAHEELSTADPGFCLSYLAHSMLLVNNFAQNASLKQRNQWLHKMCTGSSIGGMAMSEPAMGTDVLAMETQAVKKGDDYFLTGRKMWITNGTLDDKGTPADFLIVYARTGTHQGKPQISTFLVEKDFEGYQVGQKIRGKTGMRSSNTAEIVFDNCKVPASHLIGSEGDSIVHMMKNLEMERVTLAAMSLGIAKRSLQIMNHYASQRQAFGQPLRNFGQIQRYIGDSYAQYMASKAYVYDTARRLCFSKNNQRLDSDGVKLVAATMSKNVADQAMQVLGGYGYVAESVVERLWRDSKLLEIGGGTIEAHQKNITRDLLKNTSVLD